MIITLSILLGIIGLIFSIKAKRIFDKGLCEADSYRMVVEFNKSKRVRRKSTIILLTAMVLFLIYFIQLLIELNTINPDIN
jgi:hypothetical protein